MNGDVARKPFPHQNLCVRVNHQVVGITTKMASLEEAPTDKVGRHTKETGTRRFRLIFHLFYLIDSSKQYISAPYRLTKAAENMLFRTWARDPSAKDVTFLLVHPGHVKTEMGEAGGRKVRTHRLLGTCAEDVMPRSIPSYRLANTNVDRPRSTSTRACARRSRTWCSAAGSRTRGASSTTTAGSCPSKPAGRRWW